MFVGWLSQKRATKISIEVKICCEGGLGPGRRRGESRKEEGRVVRGEGGAKSKDRRGQGDQEKVF